jgi:hypothetical protein
MTGPGNLYQDRREELLGGLDFQRRPPPATVGDPDQAPTSSAWPEALQGDGYRFASCRPGSCGLCDALRVEAGP